MQRRVSDWSSRTGEMLTAVDEMLTIDPLPCALRTGTACWAKRKWPSILTAIVWRQPSKVIDSIKPTGPAMPALLIRMSSPPICDTASSKNRAMSSGSEASARSSENPSGRFACSTPAMSQPNTLAPASTNRCPSTRPRPDAAALITTRLSSMPFNRLSPWGRDLVVGRTHHYQPVVPKKRFSSRISLAAGGTVDGRRRRARFA